MLLRASRAAGELTKEALLGRVALGAGKLGLRLADKVKWPLLGTGLVLGTSGAEIMGQARQAQNKLRPEYLQAANLY